MNSCLSPSSNIGNSFLEINAKEKNQFLVTDDDGVQNLKSAIQRWRVAFPIDDIGDPSAVFRCMAAGSTSFIMVLNHVVCSCMY